MSRGSEHLSPAFERKAPVARAGDVDGVTYATHGAAYATHVVGGLLLGAALAAVVQFFVPIGTRQPLAALALALACVLASRAAERRRGEHAAEAGLAAGLVAAATVPFYAVAPAIVGAFAAGLALWITIARRGRTPIALAALACFFVNARHATGAEMLRGSDVLAELAFMASLCAYAVLLVQQRAQRWASHALALHGGGLALAMLPLLDAMRVTDAGVAALAVAATLGALFALGVKLGARPLVATTGALLALAAAAFAFLALGPALAALILLCMGAALVWHAERIRAMIERAPARA